MNVIDSFRLTGKVALVTGGSGLYGRQVVEAVAEAGAKTFLASRDLKKQEETAAGFRKQGLDVTALQLDQGAEKSIREVLKKICDQAGGVDVLVNNAVLRPMKDWSDPPESFAESMRINATGMFMMHQFFGEHMAARGHGNIVNVSSMQGVVGPDFTLYEGLNWGTPPDYFFHKGGLIQLTKFAASKLGPRGVRVNVVSPGGFYSGQDEKFVKRYNARTFLGRMANETDLKGVIVFLASDASAYITGTNIMVDAGYSAK
jgi:NAD(P)-dependent dehydrogenase (short-subunit alcohol dehydrogenase family)